MMQVSEIVWFLYLVCIGMHIALSIFSFRFSR